MKYIILILALLTTSCSQSWLLRIYEKEALNYLENGLYFKNKHNGLCFFVGDGFRSMTATCVSCDSLKNERVLLYYPQNRKK